VNRGVGCGGMAAAATGAADPPLLYTKGEVCGYGTYGTVHRATRVADGAVVAIKKLRSQNNRREVRHGGIRIEVLREIKILRLLSGNGDQHGNIVQLLDVFAHKSDALKLVFEYLETNLDVILESFHVTLTAPRTKSWSRMVLAGVAHLHEHGVLHRDIKANNLLIGANGVLKIADFGRARHFPKGVFACEFETPPPPPLPLLSVAPRDDVSGAVAVPHGGGYGNERSGGMSAQMVTVPYRAPELLLGARMYGPGIDVWACGCVIADMVLSAKPRKVQQEGQGFRGGGHRQHPYYRQDDSPPEIGGADARTQLPPPTPFFTAENTQRTHSDILQFDRLLKVLGVPQVPPLRAHARHWIGCPSACVHGIIPPQPDSSARDLTYYICDRGDWQDRYTGALADMVGLPSLASCLVSERQPSPSTLPRHFPDAPEGLLPLLASMFEMSPRRREFIRSDF
jgi:serine/threonine protein kinase